MVYTFELTLLLFYYLGRLFFFNIHNSNLSSGYVKRIFWGLVGLLIFENLFIGILFFILHTLFALIDSFIKSNKHRALLYFSQTIFILLFTIAIGGLIEFDTFYISNPAIWVLLPIKNNIPAFSFLFEITRIQKALLVAVGFIVTIKEATIIIRMLLAKISATPRKKEKPSVQDKQEYDRGKMIGILERGLIFFLIVFNQVAGIAIIIALKSLARFKEMEDKSFAEYFLIGSLLSITTAVVPAVVVKLLL